VMPGIGGTQRLARLVGTGRAIEFMVTGDLLTFERALELGLVNQVWEAASGEEFAEMVLGYAGRFCPPNRAAQAVGSIKRAVQAGSRAPIESALERGLLGEPLRGGDATVGPGARRGGRPRRSTGE
jgi:enoyl-CoA hydratase